jgi:tellurite methyltransferase
VQRSIVGFHQDDDGDWVAELSCLHNQHVRHRPPFQERAWVLDASERAARVGGPLDCPLCDRAEMPDGLTLDRTVGPFDAETLPAGLRRRHRVAERVWGCLRVLEGSVGFTMEVEPPLDVALTAGERQPIPPGVAHCVAGDGPFRLTVEFFVATPLPSGPDQIRMRRSDMTAE